MEFWANIAVVESVSSFLDSMRLLVNLQHVSEIVQSLSGYLEPEAVARQATDGLVKTFDCAFARIWLVEPDQTALRLVASSGMYTHINGFFAKVPMGAFKVGKIAQNRIPFLSNHLADEPWVKDRDWAIAHHMVGFAGYPLSVGERVVGVLAVFSHHALTPEFLEALQGLCTTLAIVLENALRYQQERRSRPVLPLGMASSTTALSEQLATVLGSARLSLVGTERSLPLSLTCLLTHAAEVLRELNCAYCRLTYSADQIALEAMVVPTATAAIELHELAASAFGELLFMVSGMSGSLQVLPEVDQTVVQVVLKVPYPACALGPRLRICCHTPVLQTAFTHLAYLAGITLCSTSDAAVPLLTDDLTQLEFSDRVLWLSHTSRSLPKGVQASVDLSTSPAQLRAAVEAITQGEPWGIERDADPGQRLSEREQEMLLLLAQGLRDRDIANQLHISERTVKFHINNVLTKLNARTRCQAIYLATVNGLISPFNG